MKSKLSFKQMVMNRLPATMLMFLIKTKSLNKYVSIIRKCADDFLEKPHFFPKDDTHALYLIFDSAIKDKYKENGHLEMYLNSFIWSYIENDHNRWHDIRINLRMLYKTPFYDV